jgi:hypothetical protein
MDFRSLIARHGKIKMAVNYIATKLEFLSLLTIVSLKNFCKNEEET